MLLTVNHVNALANIFDARNLHAPQKTLTVGSQAALHPICLDGNGACPPEDCGGIRGFYDLLNIIQDKSHPEHHYMRNWVGEKYNPESFDLNRASKRLRKLQKYITRWNSPD